jgi:hypothetical protein
MNRKSDVESILHSASQQYRDICQDYEKALRDKSLDLRVPVKNLMENLRSALDYMSHDIYENYCQPNQPTVGNSKTPRIYFPYGRTDADFKSSIGRSLPGLANSSPEIYQMIQSIQPFSCGDAWLCDFSEILNEKKHNKLTTQMRSESETYTIESKQGSVTIPVNNPKMKVVSRPGGVKLFGVPAEFREDGIYTVPSTELKHRRTKWIAFTFSGTNVNVISLLEKATMGINAFVEMLYQQI